MRFTDYLSENVRQHILQLATFTPPTSFYMSLEGSDGTEFPSEYFNYSRQSIAFRHAVSNGVDQVVVRNDAASGGNLLAWSNTSHTDGDTILNGDTAEFADSAVELAL